MDHRHPRGQYRGRRRVPTPPRSRYAAVMTTAFVGAGIVALGTGTAMPDLADPVGLSAVDASAQYGLDDRAAADDRASRNNRRNTPAASGNQEAPDVWLLPLPTVYRFTSPYGGRWGRLHPGVDLGAKEGTPIYSAAKGTVILCRWNGGYGYNVMVDHGGGYVTVYGHASALHCKEGQQVRAGDHIADVGNTGHSFGAHLHFEIRLDDKPIEPLKFLLEHGVDIKAKADVTTESAA